MYILNQYCPPPPPPQHTHTHTLFSIAVGNCTLMVYYPVLMIFQTKMNS